VDDGPLPERRLFVTWNDVSGPDLDVHADGRFTVVPGGEARTCRGTLDLAQRAGWVDAVASYDVDRDEGEITHTRCGVLGPLDADPSHPRICAGYRGDVNLRILQFPDEVAATVADEDCALEISWAEMTFSAGAWPQRAVRVAIDGTAELDEYDDTLDPPVTVPCDPLDAAETEEWFREALAEPWIGEPYRDDEHGVFVRFSAEIPGRGGRSGYVASSAGPVVERVRAAAFANCDL
jgi:hypothetical protein